MIDLDLVQARADAAHKEVGEIALHGENRWRMSIPAEPSRDSDLIIAGSLQDVPALIRALREAYAEIERLRQEQAEHHNAPGVGCAICRAIAEDDSGDIYDTLTGEASR